MLIVLAWVTLIVQCFVMVAGATGYLSMNVFQRRIVSKGFTMIFIAVSSAICLSLGVLLW